jgi:REP element-mobilizing transposase RayT
MGRLLREFLPDQVYHLTARAIPERLLFEDDVDRQLFSLRFRRVARRLRWRVFVVCLMDNHFHVTLQAPQGGIDRGMKVVNGAHARTFNSRHGRRGSLFEARYTDTPMRDEEHLVATVAYVRANPVRAGMVDAIEDWPWSTWDGSPLHALLARSLAQ